MKRIKHINAVNVAIVGVKRTLPVPHGAPVRLRVETQIGYKSVKYLQRIVVTDEFVDTGDSGWAWYVGI